MAYTGIEPEGVRLLADRLVATADLADELALGIGRAVFESGLASQTPAMMQGLADELAQTSTLLRRRADTAQGLVVDVALHWSLLSVVRAVALAPAACPLGPSTATGFSSPCDPAESIKVYSLAAGAFIPLVGFAGIKLDAAYIVRVEHLRSGHLRVTRIDEAALGVAWSAGQDVEVNGGPLTTMAGASAKAWAQLLLAQGATYEIAASELDEFIASDLLDHVERAALPGAIVGGLGVVMSVSKKIVGAVDRLPLWKAHNAVTSLRKKLNWQPPAPLSTFTEVGVTAGTNGSLGVPVLGQVPVKGKLGLAISGRAVVGFEQRATEQTLYLDVRAEIATPITYRLFGIDFSKLGAFETKVGAVRNRVTGDVARLEFTIVTELGKNIERRTVVIDLTDPTTHDDAARLVDDLTNPATVIDPTRLPDALDALEKLLGHRVTTERTTLRRMSKSTYGINVYGNGANLVVDTLDVR